MADYTNSGPGEQNIGIGANAIGKQVNIYNTSPQSSGRGLAQSAGGDQGTAA